MLRSVSEGHVVFEAIIDLLKLFGLAGDSGINRTGIFISHVASSGATFRTWFNYASDVEVDDTGLAIGPKFGELEEFAELTGKFVDCPDGDCHLESNFPTTFSPPDGLSTDLAAIGGNRAGTNYVFDWYKSEVRGYIAYKHYAVVTWDMGDYTDGT